MTALLALDFIDFSLAFLLICFLMIVGGAAYDMMSKGGKSAKKPKEKKAKKKKEKKKKGKKDKDEEPAAEEDSADEEVSEEPDMGEEMLEVPEEE